MTALAATFGPHLPGAQNEGPSGRACTQLVPPYDVAQFSPLAGFRRYTEPNPVALYEQTVLTVTGSARWHPRQVRQPGPL